MSYEPPVLEIAKGAGGTSNACMLDLPDEMLVEIFLKVGTYGEIETLGDVCSRFKYGLFTIYKRAFVQLQVELDTEIELAERNFKRQYDELGVDLDELINVLSAANRVEVFEYLSVRFALTKALVWNAAVASTSFFFGSGYFLEEFGKQLKEIKENNILHPVEVERLLCFKSYETTPLMKYVNSFLIAIETKFSTLNIPEDWFGKAHAQDMLSGMTLISLLEACKGATCTNAEIKDDGNKTAIHVQYVLTKTWWCERLDLNDNTLVHYLKIVDKMVIVNIFDYLRAKIKKRVASVSSTSSHNAFLGEFLDWTSISLTCNNPIFLEFPANSSGVRINIYATSPSEYVPESLVARCMPDNSLTVDEDCSFKLEMSAFSYDTEADTPTGENQSMNLAEHYQVNSRTLL